MNKGMAYENINPHPAAWMVFLVMELLILEVRSLCRIVLAQFDD
jgi:hypothetical protein